MSVCFLLVLDSLALPHDLSTVSYDDVLSAMLRTLIFLANLAGGIVVGVGTVRAFVSYGLDLLLQRDSEGPREDIRLRLGRSLALAVEFQLGADILGTALNPSPKDIGVLAAIVVLRTALNFFLQRELREAGLQHLQQAQGANALQPREAPRES